MSEEYKSKSKFRVSGPNTADYTRSTWYFPTIEEAKVFANHIAQEVDAEYEIYQYIGTVRQVPLPKRPIEWIGPKGSEAKTP